MKKLFYKIMYKLTMNRPSGLYWEDKLYPIKNFNKTNNYNSNTTQ